MFKSIKAPLRVIEATLLFFFSKKAEASLKGVGDRRMYTLGSPIYIPKPLCGELVTPVSTQSSFTSNVSFLRTQCR
jgi:hypothetical protein